MTKERQQLPPQITKLSVKDRRTGRKVTRYALKVRTGNDPETGKPRWINRRFDTERAAKDALAEVSDAVRRGAYVPPTTRTVRRSVEEYLDGRHGLAPSTLAQYRNLCKPLLARHGDDPVQRLSKRDLDRLVVDLRAGGVPTGESGRLSRPWGAASVNTLLKVVAMVLASEVEAGRLARNVAKSVDRVARQRREVPTLDADQVTTLLRSTRAHRLHHAWVLALLGLRRGELCGLRWRDVDLTSGVVHVANNRVLVEGEVIETDTKTTASTRELVIPADVVAVLRRARTAQAEERLAAGIGAGGEYVVGDEAGRPVRPDYVSREWKRALAGAGLPPMKLHASRHTAATTLALLGVSPAVIARWLGHRDPAFTLATYSHSQPRAYAAAGVSLGALVTIGDTDVVEPDELASVSTL